MRIRLSTWAIIAGIIVGCLIGASAPRLETFPPQSKPQQNRLDRVDWPTKPPTGARYVGP